MDDVDAKEVKILIIDDDPKVRKSISAFLEDSGYVIFEAENAIHGLNLFQQELPDLILLDLRMPEMDGLQFLEIIQDKSPDTPVIIVSGAGVMADAIRALKLGAMDFITKPIMDLAILENSIKRALEHLRLRLENKNHREHLENEIIKRT